MVHDFKDDLMNKDGIDMEGGEEIIDPDDIGYGVEDNEHHTDEEETESTTTVEEVTQGATTTVEEVADDDILNNDFSDKGKGLYLPDDGEDDGMFFALYSCI